jgi:hypothetical protein
MNITSISENGSDSEATWGIPNEARVTWGIPNEAGVKHPSHLNATSPVQSAKVKSYVLAT